MRWILVLIFLYLIPIFVLFRNYKRKNRALIYGSTYVLLVTVLVISNVCMSGAHKIQYSMLKSNNSMNETNEKYAEKKTQVDLIKGKNNKNEHNNENKNVKNNETLDSDEKKSETEKLKKQEVQSKRVNNEKKVGKSIFDNKDNKANPKIENNYYEISDRGLFEDFKIDVYTIEKKALFPMRKCIPYTKNIANSLMHIEEVEKDVENARNKCDEVLNLYKKMYTPNFKKYEYKVEVGNAIKDIQKVYEFRKKAMDSGVKLLKTKNPKYVPLITSYLNKSDKIMDNYNSIIDSVNREITE